MNSYPASSPDQQPVAPPQTVRVPMPSSRPYMTYSIMGITIGFYLLQLISVTLQPLTMAANGLATNYRMQRLTN